MLVVSEALTWPPGQLVSDGHLMVDSPCSDVEQTLRRSVDRERRVPYFDKCVERWAIDGSQQLLS